jgi:SAM-dependent methyltransferase
VRNPNDIQRKYYSEIASFYNSMHVLKDDPHYIALRYMLIFVKSLKISNVLDVGCGTGRGVNYLMENNINVKGIDPVLTMLEQGHKKHNISKELLICGDGEYLPFRENQFEAVCEFGVLHHVKNPNIMIKEMMRVANKAIFLSDNNTFGGGNKYYRIIKLFLYKMRLWYWLHWIRTGGKGYYYSDLDGVAYSYSLYESLDLLSEWADRIIIIPTQNLKDKGLFQPLLTSSHVLLCAIKENEP